LQSLFRLRLPCLVEHGWSQVDAYGMAHDAGESAGQQARAAGDIERRVRWARFCQLHDPIQRFLVANGLGLGKRNCLAGELIEDAGSVVHDLDFKFEISNFKFQIANHNSPMANHHPKITTLKPPVWPRPSNPPSI